MSGSSLRSFSSHEQSLSEQILYVFPPVPKARIRYTIGCHPVSRIAERHDRHTQVSSVRPLASRLYGSRMTLLTMSQKTPSSSSEPAREKPAKKGIDSDIPVDSKQKRQVMQQEHQRRFIANNPPATPLDGKLYKLVLEKQLDVAEELLLANISNVNLRSLTLLASALRQQNQTNRALFLFYNAMGAALEHRRSELTHESSTELILCLSLLEKHDQVLDMVQFARSKIGRLGPLSYRALVLALASQIGEKFSWINLLQVLNELHEKRLFLKVQTYNFVLHMLGTNGAVSECLELLDLMETRYKVEPDSTSYNTLLSIYVQNPDGHNPDQILDRMKARNVAPDRITYNLMINSYKSNAKAKLASVFEILDVMRSSKSPELQPDLITYNSALAVCEQAGDADSAKQIVNMVSKSRVSLDSRSYTAILGTYAKCNDSNSAKSLFDSLRKSKAPRMSIEMYTTMINLYAKTKSLKEAEELHEELLRRTDIRPSVISFNSLLNVYRAVGTVACAEKVMKDMRDMSLCPDVISYSVFIDILGRAGKISRIQEVLKQMQAESIEPNIVTFTSALNGCIRKGDMDSATEILEEMKLRKLKPNGVTYSTLIQGSCARGDLDRAIRLFEELVSTNDRTAKAPTILGSQDGSRYEISFSGATLQRENFVRDAVSQDSREVSTFERQNHGIFLSLSALRAMIQASAKSGDAESLSYILNNILSKSNLMKSLYNMGEIQRFLKWLSSVRAEHGGVISGQQQKRANDTVIRLLDQAILQMERL